MLLLIHVRLLRVNEWVSQSIKCCWWSYMHKMEAISLVATATDVWYYNTCSVWSN